MFEGLLQPEHLLIIFLIALIVFGPKKLPELGKGLGKSIREFKDSMKETTGSIKNAGEQIMQDVGVSPDQAKKITQGVQTARQVTNPKGLMTTLGQRAFDSTGLKDAVTSTPAAEAKPEEPSAVPPPTA
jgi:sec-independent protein translocase protein TatA